MPRSLVSHFNRSRSSSQTSHEPVPNTIENVLFTRPGPLPVVGKKQNTSGTVSSLSGKSSLLSSSPSSLPSTSSPAFVRDSNGSLHDGRFYDSLKALEAQLASTPSPFASSFSSHTVPGQGRRPYSPRSDSDSDESHRRRTSRNRTSTNALQLSTSPRAERSHSDTSSDSEEECDGPATEDGDDQWPPPFSPPIAMQPFDEEVEELQLSQAFQKIGPRDRLPHTRRSYAYSIGVQRTHSPFNTTRDQRKPPHSYTPEETFATSKVGPLNEGWRASPDHSTGEAFSVPAPHHLPQPHTRVPSRHSLDQSSTDISRSTSWSPRWRTMALSPSSSSSAFTATSPNSTLSTADNHKLAQRASIDGAELPTYRKESPSPSLRHTNRLSGAASISHRALSFIFSDRERSTGHNSARASPQLEPVKDEWVSGFTSFVDLQESARARLRVQANIGESTGMSPASSSHVDPRARTGSMNVSGPAAPAGSESPRSVVLNLAMGSSPNAPIPGIGGRWFEDEARRLSTSSRLDSVRMDLAAQRCLQNSAS
ncbi:hypothetical protein OC845_002856 [Tilletia horrida]|nr:hypothetical protein OC845_002856 [Tilletia horrida]